MHSRASKTTTARNLSQKKHIARSALNFSNPRMRQNTRLYASGIASWEKMLSLKAWLWWARRSKSTSSLLHLQHNYMVRIWPLLMPCLLASLNKKNPESLNWHERRQSSSYARWAIFALSSSLMPSEPRRLMISRTVRIWKLQRSTFTTSWSRRLQIDSRKRIR